MTTDPRVEDKYRYYDAQGQPHKTAQEAIQASQQFEETVGGRNPSGGNCPQKAEDARSDDTGSSQSGSTNSGQSGQNQSDKR